MAVVARQWVESSFWEKWLDLIGIKIVNFDIPAEFDKEIVDNHNQGWLQGVSRIDL
jgi:hypothetical protein